MEELLDGTAETTGWVANITDNPIVGFVIKILLGIGVFIILLLISKIISKVIKKNITKHMEESNPNGAKKVGSLLGNIVFYVLVLLCVFISFEIMGLDIGLIVSGVSLGVGLAFKEILGNMFAGMMILYTKEFKMGDVIEVQSDQNYFGRIEEITIRYTVIRTLDLREVVIPNMTMISVPVRTFSSETLVKLNTMIGIHYDSDVEKAIQVIKEATNSFDFVKEKENTTVFVTEFQPSRIMLKCIFCFDPQCGIIGDFAVGYVNEKIREEFSKNNIQFTYDQIILDINNQDSKHLENKLQNAENPVQIANQQLNQPTIQTNIPQNNTVYGFNNNNTLGSDQ